MISCVILTIKVQLNAQEMAFKRVLLPSHTKTEYFCQKTKLSSKGALSQNFPQNQNKKELKPIKISRTKLHLIRKSRSLIPKKERLEGE